MIRAEITHLIQNHVDDGFIEREFLAVSDTCEPLLVAQLAVFSADEFHCSKTASPERRLRPIDERSIDLLDWPFYFNFDVKAGHSSPRRRSVAPSAYPPILQKNSSRRKLALAARADPRTHFGKLPAKPLARWVEDYHPRSDLAPRL